MGHAPRPQARPRGGGPRLWQDDRGVAQGAGAMTPARPPAEPKRCRVSLHESKPHYVTDEDGVPHEAPPRCSGCDMRWPCDAFLLNKQLDGLATQLAEEQATNLRLMTHS